MAGLLAEWEAAYSAPTRAVKLLGESGTAERIRVADDYMYNFRQTLNIFYYNIFRFECFTQDLVGLPISAVAEYIGLPRRYAERTGKDWEGEVQKVLNDPRGGVSFYISGILVTTLVYLVLFTAINLLCWSLKLPIEPHWKYGVFAAIVPSVIITWFMFPTDRKKYLKDFRSFALWSNTRKRNSALITFAIVLTTLLAFIVSFASYLQSLSES